MKHREISQLLEDSTDADEFVVRENQFESLCIKGGQGGLTKSIFFSEGMSHSVVLYVDQRQGRGHAAFKVIGDIDLRPQIAAASARARLALGPGWQLPPAAAPARVILNDDSFKIPLEEITESIQKEIQRGTPASIAHLDTKIEVRREVMQVAVSNGFNNRQEATTAWVSIGLQSRLGRFVRIEMRARRFIDLKIESTLEKAIQRSEIESQARSLTPARFDLALWAGAYLPKGSHDYGLWTPLVEQSSADLARVGNVRYLREQPIGKTPVLGDTLTLSSDGVVDYGHRSAVFGELGQAIRRFSIVTESVASGYAVGYRDEALGMGTANGGVRNLVVESGRHEYESLLQPHTKPLLIVHRIGEISTDSQGGLRIVVTGGTWRTWQGKQFREEEIRGGVLIGNVYTWLGNANYSKEVTDVGWCKGPRVIRFNNVRGG